eukprot:TRINITY_DN3394_c0_g1_i2.p1 TRINITY_DN3394_c0_g1~~TRINITY_DN3394_c0_g1_i2.p1  ORF type:complete len:150 (-),score=6.17 TRINITY_DN3394_c0_g1_i2:28-411(-)
MEAFVIQRSSHAYLDSYLNADEEDEDLLEELESIRNTRGLTRYANPIHTDVVLHQPTLDQDPITGETFLMDASDIADPLEAEGTDGSDFEVDDSSDEEELALPIPEDFGIYSDEEFDINWVKEEDSK